MPTYGYACERCGHEVEAFQSITAHPLRKCPECGKSAMKKVVSAAAFRLKGSGWYETDFKSGNKKNVAADDKTGKKGGGAKKAAGNKSSGDSSKTKKANE